MLLDRAKGVEAQTRKLFRVCKQRSIPIFSFVNKMDRPGRDPFDLIGEVESVLGIGVYPVTWPIFRSGTFRGVWHRVARRVYLFDPDHASSSAGVGSERPPVEIAGIDDPVVREELDVAGHDQLRHDAELLEAAGDGFDRERFLEGKLSPLFFGSAINNFGLEPFLESFCELMPPPRPRATDQGDVAPERDEFSGFVFKIQANMDKAHRDRVAFVRICSGKMTRGMKVTTSAAARRSGSPTRRSSWRASGTSSTSPSRATSSASTIRAPSRSATRSPRAPPSPSSRSRASPRSSSRGW